MALKRTYGTVGAFMDTHFPSWGTVTTHVFTVAEGAGGRCEGLGQDLFDQYVFGWLAGVLARRPVGSAV